MPYICLSDAQYVILVYLSVSLCLNFVKIEIMSLTFIIIPGTNTQVYTL